MNFLFKANCIFIGIFLTGISFCKTTGPLPESEAYMIEIVEMISPENEWIDYTIDQEKEVTININGDSITEPDCSIGREDEFIRNNWNSDFQNRLQGGILTKE